ncbi:MAG: carbohydrate kinase family protein [Defluviitaleaceae bacterium]|nr:carbohydrate kinase family protein [Defluviitaleaceae bacterium]
MNPELSSNVESLIAGLEAKIDDISGLNVLMGADGFVDSLVHVVDTRTSSSDYSRIDTIEGFGRRVLSASGLSTNIELVAYQTKLGGNGPNMAAALLEYGTPLSYFGSIGTPGQIDPVFREMADRCAAIYPLGPPGHTDALEFSDGKLMMGKTSTFSDITWDSVKAAFGGAASMADAISKAGLLGIENWTMLPHMSRIWEGIISEVLPLLPSPVQQKRPLVFFDLCDPVKRSTSDIIHALSLISAFEAKFRVILGLNHKELFEIASALGISYNKDTPDNDLSQKVYEKLGIHTLVVHPVREAFCWSQGAFFHVVGPYCEKPVLTTGAGDNFNAGFALCLALGLGAREALTLGVATSGFYVRNGRSPSLAEARTFLHDWKHGLL